MTIRFIQQWNGHSPDEVNSSLGSTEEARLVGLNLASYDLDGANDGAEEFVKAKRNLLTGGSIFSDPALNAAFVKSPSSGYFCHLWAGSSANGDAVIPDISGNGYHGTFDSAHTKALAWLTAGYASTDATAAHRTFLLPVLNFDYAAGESLIIVWKGRGTAPASLLGIVADSEGSSDPGVAVKVDATGKIQTYLSNGTGRFCDMSTSVLVEPTVTHTYAVAIDGVAKKYEHHEDGIVTRSLVAMGDGVTAYDTRSAKPVKLGTQDSSSTAAKTVALSTQALIILRGRVGLGLPTGYRTLMQQLARSPDRLVVGGQW